MVPTKSKMSQHPWNVCFSRATALEDDAYIFFKQKILLLRGVRTMMIKPSLYLNNKHVDGVFSKITCKISKVASEDS